MPGSRASFTGGTLAGMNSAIRGLPRGEMCLDQGEIIRVVPIDDIRAGGLPDASMRQDILERRTDGAQTVRLTHPIRMQRDAHNAALLGALGIDRVEMVLDLTRETFRLLAAPVQDHVVQFDGVWNRKQRAGFAPRRERL